MAFLKVRPFIKMFPLRLIRKYIMTPFQQLNFEYYNMSLSYLNFIMMGLLQFYVNYDLRFCTKIHSRDAQSMDPFYRQFVRNNLQKNRLVTSKYLEGVAKLGDVSPQKAVFAEGKQSASGAQSKIVASSGNNKTLTPEASAIERKHSSDLGILESIAEKFKSKAVDDSDDDLDLNGGIQIKDLLIFCIKTFPGVITQNRLSLGMQILDKIFNLLAVTLTYGFWKASELEQLGKVIRSAVDSLVKVENIVSEYSSGFSAEDVQKMFQSVRLCRRFITVSIIQIIIQYNDAVFISYFNDVGTSFSLRGSEKEHQ